MKRRATLALLGVIACARVRRVEHVGPLLHGLLTVGDELGAGASDDEAFGASELERIAHRMPQTAASAGSQLAALNGTIFGSLGFVREVDEPSLRFVLLPSVLRSRRGSCVGLGSLYLALAERLGLPLEGVARPGHFYVRMAQAGHVTNVELLRRGEAMPDAWYEARFPIPGGSARAYGRALSAQEVLGVVAYDIGIVRQREGRLAEARRAYESARTRFPDLAEAHASLGNVLALLGERDAASAAYAAARRVSPNLPGLEHNLETVRTEAGPPAGP